jgi:hypothetical protein
MNKLDHQMRQDKDSNGNKKMSIAMINENEEQRYLVVKR